MKMKKPHLDTSLKLPPPRTRENTRPAGVSLIIAIIFVSALLLVMGGLYEARLHVIQSLGNYDKEDKARNLADSAVELAAFWAASHKDGQNSDDQDAKTEKLLALLYEAAKDVGINDCEKKRCAGFTVTGRAAPENQLKFQNTSWYSTPVRETGDAAKKCIVDEKNDPDPDAFANDPCNWNKLYIGESADLPLYYKDINGLVHAVSGNFLLRMRAPLCADIYPKKAPNYCDKNGRVILYPQVVKLQQVTAPFRNVDKDPVLVQWVMNDTNGTSSLVASDVLDPLIKVNKLRDMLSPPDKNKQNTEISGGRINDANPTSQPTIDVEVDNYIVLQKKYTGKANNKKPQFIKDFLRNIGPNGMPVLHLSLIDQPTVDSDATPGTALSSSDINNNDLYVTYLEYQLLAQDVVADQKSSLMGFAEVGDFRKEFKKDLKRPTTPAGFALENL